MTDDEDAKLEAELFGEDEGSEEDDLSSMHSDDSPRYAAEKSKKVAAEAEDTAAMSSAELQARRFEVSEQMIGCYTRLLQSMLDDPNLDEHKSDFHEALGKLQDYADGINQRDHRTVEALSLEAKILLNAIQEAQ